PRPGRERVLTEDELRAMLATLTDGDDYSDIVKLIVLCAARRSEIGGLRWDEIDLGNAVVEIPASRMKANRPHVIPLSGPTLELLRRRPRTGDYVCGRGRGFQGWSARRKALDAAIGGAPMYPSKNIIRNAMNSKDHTTLVAAVKAAGQDPAPLPSSRRPMP